jgi:hypothetical protein
MIALIVLLVIGRFTLISSWLSFLNRFAVAGGSGYVFG